MHCATFQTIDEAYESLAKTVLAKGAKFVGRLGEMTELLNVAFEITNVRSRLLKNTRRAVSKKFAAGELAWHLSGSNEVDFISHYSKSWKNYSDDGSAIGGSCYGHSIFRLKDGVNQYQRLLELLRGSPNTRRAVLQLYALDRGLNESLKDVACTMLLQFFLREGHLYATAYMRSNDMMYGLPYDVFLFTTLQEMLAVDLGCQLGTYTHSVGSLHIYARHTSLFESIEGGRASSEEMRPMEETKSLPAFLALEKERRISAVPLTESQLARVGPFWRELLTYIN